MEGDDGVLDEELESIEGIENWIAIQEAEGRPTFLSEVGTDLRRICNPLSGVFDPMGSCVDRVKGNILKRHAEGS